MSGVHDDGSCIVVLICYVRLAAACAVAHPVPPPSARATRRARRSSSWVGSPSGAGAGARCSIKDLLAQRRVGRCAHPRQNRSCRPPRPSFLLLPNTPRPPVTTTIPTYDMRGAEEWPRACSPRPDLRVCGPGGRARRAECASAIACVRPSVWAVVVGVVHVSHRVDWVVGACWRCGAGGASSGAGDRRLLGWHWDWQGDGRGERVRGGAGWGLTGSRRPRAGCDGCPHVVRRPRLFVARSLLCRAVACRSSPPTSRALIYSYHTHLVARSIYEFMRIRTR